MTSTPFDLTVNPTRRAAAVLVLVTALAIAGCNSSGDAPGSPTARSPPPSSSGVPLLTGIAAEPDGAGLQHATEFSFQPVGEAGANPTFAWTLGEGESADAGRDARHVYAQAGTFTVRVEAHNAAGTSAATRSVAVRSLAGAWSGTVSGHTNLPPGQSQPVQTFNLVLDQTPSHARGSVTGQWSDNAGCRQQTMLVQVAHPRDVMISLESFFCNDTDFTLTGTLDATGNVIEGRCANGGRRARSA